MKHLYGVVAESAQRKTFACERCGCMTTRSARARFCRLCMLARNHEFRTARRNGGRTDFVRRKQSPLELRIRRRRFLALSPEEQRKVIEDYWEERRRVS